MTEQDVSIQQALHQAEQSLISGNPAQVETICRAIIARAPQHAKALHILGFLALLQNRPEEGLELLQRSVAAQPDDIESQLHLANALVSNRQFERAAELCGGMTKSHPHYARAWAWLGISLFETGQFDQSLAAFQQSIRLDPNDAEAHNNFARILFEFGQSQQSMVESQRAISLRPKWHEPYLHLANALKDTGQIDRAVAALRQGLAIKPDWPSAHDNLAYTLYFHPDDDNRLIHIEHARWQKQFAEPLRAVRSYANDRSPDRRLKIGYVSPDFRDHVVGRNLVPLFENHDRNQFQIVCYSNTQRPDALTARMRASVDEWRETAALNDVQLTDLIGQDRIDILVDLSLHMAYNRLLVFARKPAPVQVTFAGYPGTTGLETIDYRLTDPHLDPAGANDSLYSEQSIRLPHSFWCYDPLATEPTVNSLPADANGWITFGCLNNFCKVDQKMLELWGRIMAAVPDSRLLLLCPQGDHRRDVLAKLQGVAPHRVEFLEKRSRSDYLRLYHQVDLCLDTFPYNGHTTTLDAYWMGVPTVSLCGTTAVSRAGFSQATNLGLTEFVTNSPQQFVQIGIALAGDRARLRDLRATLRSRLEASPLMDGKRFAGDIENAYRDMWRRWCEKV